MRPQRLSHKPMPVRPRWVVMSTDGDMGPQDEMELLTGVSETKLHAVGMILAAIYGVASAIPISAFFGSVGVSGSIGLSICIAPLFGILLGPKRGFAYGLVAGVIQAALATVIPSAALALAVPTMVLGPSVSGLFTGLALRPWTTVAGKRIPGPSITIIYLLLVIILYEIPEYEAWWFPAVYFAAVITALLLQVKEVRFDPSAEGWKKYLQVVPFTIIGTATDFSMMTLGAVYLMGIPAPVFGFVIFPFMLGERIAAIVVSAIIASVALAAFSDLWTGTTE